MDNKKRNIETVKPPDFLSFGLPDFIRYLLLIAGFFTLSALQAQDVPKIRIDPAQAYGGTISDYFGSVEYIPLETTKESLFGEIGQMVVTPGSIVIYDQDTKATLFFKKDGRFIKKIKSKDMFSTWLWYDWTSFNLIVEYINNEKNISISEYYSNDGKLLRTEKKNLNTSTEYGWILLEDDFSVRMGSCLRNKGERPDTLAHYLVNVYKGSELYKSFLPFTHLKNPAACTWGGGGLRATNIIKDKSIFVCTPLDHKLYRITKDSATFISQFVFPAKYSFDQDALVNHNEHFIDSMRSILFITPNKAWSVSNILFGKGDQMLFKVNCPTPGRYMSNTMPYNYIYNTLTNRLAAMERLLPDTSSFFLPVLDQNSGILMSTGLVYDDESLYTELSSLKMFATYNENKARTIAYPTVLQKYFLTEGRKSNPVVVRLKLKE